MDYYSSYFNLSLSTEKRSIKITVIVKLLIISLDCHLDCAIIQEIFYY